MINDFNNSCNNNNNNNNRKVDVAQKHYGIEKSLKLLFGMAF